MLNINDLKLERFALRELPAAELQEIETRLKTDPVLRDRLRALEESNTAILQNTTPELFLKRLRALEHRRTAEAAMTNPVRSASRSFGVWKPLLGSLALALPLLAILTIPNLRAPRPENERDLGSKPSIVEIVKGTEGVGVKKPAPAVEAPLQPAPVEAAATEPSEDGIRLKGLEPHLAIFRKTDKGSEPLHPGEKARPGQLLRIGYQAAGFPYGAILSVDGNGNVTLHWPASGELSGRLESGEALLPSSFELDAAPDYERFYFVVSKRPFALDPLLQSLHENEFLPDPKKIKAIKESESRIVRFEVLKESGI